MRSKHSKYILREEYFSNLGAGGFLWVLNVLGANNVYISNHSFVRCSDFAPAQVLEIR